MAAERPDAKKDETEKDAGAVIGDEKDADDLVSSSAEKPQRLG